MRASDFVGALGVDFSRLLGFSRVMQNLCENLKSKDSLPGSDQSSPPKKPRPAGATGGKAGGRGRIKEIHPGTRFGRLVVVGRGEANRWGQTRWWCRCDCGATKQILDYNLKAGGSRSCGCSVKESVILRCRTHGHTGTPAYVSWQEMKSRCRNPNVKDYTNYGGRGLTISKSWLRFENFYADMGPRPPGMSLDRKDNNLGYSKENCRWATRTQQNRNKSSNRWITFSGKTLCVTDWEEELGFKRGLIRSRLDRGWSVERSLTQPIRAAR